MLYLTQRHISEAFTPGDCKTAIQPSLQNASLLMNILSSFMQQLRPMPWQTPSVEWYNSYLFSYSTLMSQHILSSNISSSSIVAVGVMTDNIVHIK